MSKSMTLKPRLSEKAFNQSKDMNVYVFQVPKESNKTTILNAIESQFDVTVTSVNVMVAKGKTKTTYRKRGGRATGTRVDVKKAYVTLKSGDQIAIFANEEDDKKSKKLDKKSGNK